jgi:WD40 repeat protein
MKKQVILLFAIFAFLLTGTTIAVLYGRGYRFGYDNGKPDLKKTGILAAKSTPEGAAILIDDHLTGATNENINLTPKQYSIRIQRDGYLPWTKNVIIEEEVVTGINAFLFPTAPKLDSITNIGVTKATLDPSRTKIAYTVASQSARKNGIYVFDTLANPVLSLQGASRQISDDTTALMSQADVTWSPDGESIIASISGELGPTTYQLNARQMNNTPRDVTAIYDTLQAEWATEKQEKEQALIQNLKKPVRKLIADNFRIIAWSPDESKILYQASRSAELPFMIKPRLIGINKLYEQRKLNNDAIYVYDIKEDVNYKALDALPKDCNLLIPNACKLPIQWMPDSNHLIVVEDKRIDVVEMDGSNRTTVYAGPFIDTYVFPWADMTRIVMLTNLNNPQIQPNLYTISLK